MFGLFLALLIAGWKYFISHQAAAVIFLSTTNILFWWYVITASILLAISLVVYLALILGGTIGGAASGAALGETKGGIVGGVLGFFGAGALSIISLVIFVVKKAVLIFGVYLLHHSLIITDGLAEWNMTKVIIGGALFIIGLVLNKRSKS